MKQSILIFLVCVIVSGCCVSTTETAPIQHETLEMPVPNQVCTFTYRHHDYIQFYVGTMACIVHDPDCVCCNGSNI
jgi:hypothetical protein